MPWTIKKGGGTCSVDEYAVIKNADGSTAGCHPTADAAKKQVAALYANDKSNPPPKRGLDTALEEHRALPADAAGLEIRTLGDGDGPTVDRFGGYAAVWNTRAAIGNPKTFGFYEQCNPSMVTKTLQEGDQRFFIDHNPYYIVARKSAGTLTLAADGHGLSVDAAMDDELSYVRDLKANVRNKNITGMSFGFKVVKDDWQKERSDDGADVEVRTLLEVQLVEVSAVTFPAYSTTQAELKSVATALRHRGDVDAIERRAQYRPELLELCGVEVGARPTIIDLGSDRKVDNHLLRELHTQVRIHAGEPADATRGDHDDHVEPAASTQLPGPSPADRLRVLATRFHLPMS